MAQINWSPYQTRAAQRVSQPQPSGNVLVFVLVIALIAAAFYIGNNRGQGPITGPDPAPVPVIVDDVVIDDSSEQETPVDRPSIKDTYVVRVFDTTPTREVWLSKQLQSGQRFWISWVAEKGMKLETIDPVNVDGEKNPRAETFLAAAKERGITAPFWMHVYKGGDVLSVTPFSEEIGIDDVKQIILNSVQE